MSKVLVILGDQLFPVSFYKDHKTATVFMAEDVGLCTHYKYHKHKIALFLTAMRNYADDLRAHGFTVHYEELSDVPFMERLKNFLHAKKVSQVLVPEIQDKFFEREFLGTVGVPVTNIGSKMFLCPRDEFRAYLFYHPKPFMKTFYERERKRLKVLLSGKDKPEGGHWSYDVENRKKAPKVLTNKELAHKQDEKHFPEVASMVELVFKDHPGDLSDFWLPTTRKAALKGLEHFIDNHLSSFGDYQDALTDRAPFLYHSLISPAVNMGLLTPEEVLEKVLQAHEVEKKIPLASVEGFIRQVMGWREFVRGIYQNFSDVEESKNFFGHHRKMSEAWYDGTTGIAPVDQAIKKALKYGYCHHIERLMVLSNFMLLCELDPKEVHKWFMELFVDSADWVMGPNVYGMGQFSDGGIFATKPYISGSNYILKMSDYKRGEWCEVWDALFWRFIGKHKTFFAKNPRLSMMVKQLEKMDGEKKKRLEKIASDFLKAMTNE